MERCAELSCHCLVDAMHWRSSEGYADFTCKDHSADDEVRDTEDDDDDDDKHSMTVIRVRTSQIDGTTMKMSVMMIMKNVMIILMLEMAHNGEKESLTARLC